MTGPRRPRGWVRVLVVLAIIAASRSGARPGAARSARAAASPAPADSAAKHASTAPEPPFHISARNLTGGHGPEGDVLFLNGDIHVTRGRTLLTADSGRYVQTTRLIDLQGHVKLIDSTTTATCDHAEFSENDDRLNLDGNVVLVDREATLRSPMGWYDRRNGTAS
ncbi:MAG TPA: OstA-like protein, partial [Candidatus Acidoferrales bacterium]|nr:OstA-like protein [Candidatus Acidoferrales bacterium]